ncbi:hypothetical protein [Kocuria tytonis]|uniref:hypothetical protein n=1 Tax=Kocuria tytonis TaxID=2054280 RepID=UPI0011C3A18A|nr:hypothetical protein [Kocuria tytonis]
MDANLPIADIFSDLTGAFLRAPLNYHRLNQLTCGESGLQEETITDLLVNEMAGGEYRVDAVCPAQGQSCADTCKSWGDDFEQSDYPARVKQLTRREEGGYKGKQAGVGADWVLEVRQKNKAVRMLVQAKRINVNNQSLAGFAKSKQIRQLESAAQRLHAAPFYAFYLKHGDPHEELTTACKRHTQAWETSILLISAERVKSLQNSSEWVSSAWPLRCLGGCPELGNSQDDVFGKIENIIKYYYPKRKPIKIDDGFASISEPASTNELQSISIDSNVWRPQSILKAEKNAGLIMVVRVGKPRHSDVDGVRRQDEVRRIGWHTDPSLTDEEWKEATRKYWRVDLKKANTVKYLVAAHRGEVQKVYKVIKPGAFTVYEPVDGDGNRRVAFEVSEVVSEDDYCIISQVAKNRLKNIKNQSPFVYAEIDNSVC